MRVLTQFLFPTILCSIILSVSVGVFFPEVADPMSKSDRLISPLAGFAVWTASVVVGAINYRRAEKLGR